MPKLPDPPADKDNAPASKISPEGDDRVPAALDAKPLAGDPAAAERPREAPAGIFAALFQSEKFMEKWLLSSSAPTPKREERPASRAPEAKPIPILPVPVRNENRKGEAGELQATRNDTTSRNATADAGGSKAPGIRPAPTLPVPVRNENRKGEAGDQLRAQGDDENGPKANADAKRSKAPSSAVVRLRNERHPSAAVEFQERRAGAMLPAFDGVLPLPQIARRRSYGTLISFVLCVLLPTFAIAAYLYLYASDEYYAEFRFSVQQGVPILPGTTPTTSSASSGSSSSPPGVTSLLTGSAPSPSPLGGSAPSPSVSMPQNFMVNDYLISQKAVEDLQSHISVKALYSRPEINWLERFDARQPMEEFVSYFHRFFFWADYDQVTGVAIATVKAFTPQDALSIAKTMATLAENLINEMNARADRDAVRFAEEESQRAEKRLNEARAELLEFRTKAGVISPNAGTAPSVLTKEQVVELQRHAAQDTVGAHAFADVIGTYEKITFDVQYAQDSVVRARQALDLARANAAVQHFYIEPYVTPQLPESPAYPLRALDTCLAGLAIFGAWLLGLLLVRTVQDHVV